MPVSTGCDTLPIIDVLEAQEKGDRVDEADIFLGLSPNLLICVCVRAEEFNEETLHRGCRAGVSLGMIGDAWDVGASLVGKTMHRTAVNNELPVSISAVHFFNKGAHVRHWDMRV